jgi:hypothetical protein
LRASERAAERATDEEERRGGGGEKEREREENSKTDGTKREGSALKHVWVRTEFAADRNLRFRQGAIRGRRIAVTARSRPLKKRGGGRRSLASLLTATVTTVATTTTI